MNRSISYCGVLSLAAFLSVVPMQAQKDKDKDKDRDARDRGVAAVAPGASNRLVREVRHELVMLPYYGVFDNLAYRVDGSTVTLLGEVTRPTLKSDAGNVVKNVEGVTRVDNQIRVLPLSSMDDGLRIAEYRAIYGHPGLDRYAMQSVPPIHIIVDNGKVTLEGTVATQGDKDLAALRANTVSGVFSVTNNLRVENEKH